MLVDGLQGTDNLLACFVVTDIRVHPLHWDGESVFIEAVGQQLLQSYVDATCLFKRTIRALAVAMPLVFLHRKPRRALAISGIS